MARKLGEGPAPSGALRLLLRAPITLFRIGLGPLLGKRFLLLDHVGRKSGATRSTVLEVVKHDPERDVFYVAVGFGPRSQWFQNLQKTPQCTIQVGNKRSSRRARALSPQEGADLLVEYARRYPSTARKLMRFMRFEVDGSEADYRQVAEQLGLRFVALPGAIQRPKPRKSSQSARDWQRGQASANGRPTGS